MEQAEEADSESETERPARFGLEHEGRVVEPQLVERLLGGNSPLTNLFASLAGITAVSLVIYNRWVTARDAVG